MNQPLNLSIQLLPRPAGSTAEVLASIALRFDFAGLAHAGDVLLNPLIPGERENLRWYLEEYAEWPYEQFLERARKIEASLPELGKRLYYTVFGSAGALNLVQAWRLCPLPDGTQRQISIISDIPSVLSLPWEMLHDEQGFLALDASHPVALIRRLPQRELAVFPTLFEPPLRILLVTARPTHEGFVDPRGIARELLDEVQPQLEAGSMALEFLRPPTLSALRTRLSDPAKPPIHVLHFDGHGIFAERQGLLAFEDEKGRLDRVRAEELAQALQGSGVRLAVLTACHSAQFSADDAFSSVAARLIGSGIDAVVAMSSSILVTSAAHYAEAFYRGLAAGAEVSIAQERARLALYSDPHRHLHRRGSEDGGTVVSLQDWWVSHSYQQRLVSLQPTTPKYERRPVSTPALPPLNPDFPPEPRYGFSGRARELLQIERALLHEQVVVISGFGGSGKTALAREAAAWLTRTGLYEGACFVSFEHGGDAALLLSTLGHDLGLSDASYQPQDPASALAHLAVLLQETKLLLVADNLESILSAGEAPLEPAARSALWDVLLRLRELGVGLLLTSRSRELGDGRLAAGKRTRHLPLRGLAPTDAYTLASRLLVELGIDRSRVPYAELRDLLAQLDQHPLAIQLVLPRLQDLPLATIRADFAALLPRFADDTETGHNRSLLASLEYSIRRLNDEQCTLLSRLVVFEGGASQDNLLAITEIPESPWAALRLALEQVGLLMAERIDKEMRNPFLRFHPVLVPYLRLQEASDDESLRARYARQYHGLVNSLRQEDTRLPQPVRARVRKELPNLQRALDLLLREGQVDAASDMAHSVASFLTIFGLMREREVLWRRLNDAVIAAGSPSVGGTLTEAEWLREIGMGEDERRKEHLPEALARLDMLLTRIEAQPEGTPVSRGSYAHSRTLYELALCLGSRGQLAAAEAREREALSIIDALLRQEPENLVYIRQRGILLGSLGNVLRALGEYSQSMHSYTEALAVFTQLDDQRSQASTLGQLGKLATNRRDYEEARLRHTEALQRFRALGEPTMEADAWFELGMVAQKQQRWAEAEQYFRECLAIDERVGDLAEVTRTCNQLAIVAFYAGRPDEAEGWWKRALELDEQLQPQSLSQARHLDNLAELLLREVQASRAPQARLSEGRRYSEQSLAIKERLDAPSHIWATYSILAAIAELQGQQETARNYRRREREAYAAFAGNRYHINREHGQLIADIATIARGFPEPRAQVEAELSGLEGKGWRITDAVQGIWSGERDWHTLVEDLDGQNALLVLRVLETLHAQPEERK